MLIKINETLVVNTQQATRLFVRKTFDEYGVMFETLDHLYTIKNAQQEQKRWKCWKKYLISTTEGRESLRSVIVKES